MTPLQYFAKTVTLYLLTFLLFFYIYKQKITCKRVIIFTVEFFVALGMIHLPYISNLYATTLSIITKSLTSFSNWLDQDRTIMVVRMLVSTCWLLVIISIMRYIYKTIIRSIYHWIITKME